MKNKILLLLALTSAVGGVNAQWIQLNTGNGFDIFDLSFPNAQTGYICGYGGLFKKTTNGGTNWTDMSFPTTQHNLNAVYFFNPNTGLLASTNDTVYRTTDGTQNWSVRLNIGFQVLDFHFIDSLNGYASGNNRLARTTNGGLNWTVSTIQSYGQIYFINQNTGWTVSYPGAGSSNILKTTDGGSTWQVQHTTSDFRILYDVFFVNENTGYASGYRHCIFKTTNGGANWVSQHDESSAQGLYSIYFINENTGWTAGDYYSATNTSTYYTTNGGINWVNTNGIVTGGRLNRVKINNSPVGYIAGQNQRIYRTTNAGGLTGIKTNGSSKPSEYTLFQNYPNPFNPVTQIRFDIPGRSNVKLSVYDINGRLAEVLVNSSLNAGSYEISWNAGKFSSGVYFYRIEAGNFTDTKRLLLVK
ncbi:MAG: T9SS type A sorting domain-containing protein [Ignavibacteria bacterium]|nr:T9SS type A sorting domain-containing protein [Ignavibacteria bacterium]